MKKINPDGHLISVFEARRVGGYLFRPFTRSFPNARLKTRPELYLHARIPGTLFHWRSFSIQAFYGRTLTALYFALHACWMLTPQYFSTESKFGLSFICRSTPLRSIPRISVAWTGKSYWCPLIRTTTVASQLLRRLVTPASPLVPPEWPKAINFPLVRTPTLMRGELACYTPAIMEQQIAPN